MGKAAINSERRAQIGLEKRARTRAKILAAAFEVIGHEHGRWVRIEEITKFAQVARPTFYTYFTSTEELLAALSYELSHDFNTAVTEYCRRRPNRAEEASAAIRYYLRKAAADHRWGWGMANVSYGGPIFGAETCAAAHATAAAGIASGEFKLPNADVGRDMILGTTLAAMVTQLTGKTGPDYPEQIAKHILIGIGVPEAKATHLVSLSLPELASKCSLSNGGNADAA